MVDVPGDRRSNAAYMRRPDRTGSGRIGSLLGCPAQNGAAEIHQHTQENLRCMHDAPQDIAGRKLSEEEFWRICGGRVTDGSTSRRWRGWSFAPLHNAATGCANMALTFNRHAVWGAPRYNAMRFMGGGKRSVSTITWQRRMAGRTDSYITPVHANFMTAKIRGSAGG